MCTLTAVQAVASGYGDETYSNPRIRMVNSERSGMVRKKGIGCGGISVDPCNCAEADNEKVEITSS